ncbi:MAG: dephospho-CoA kinase [Acidobacteriaceae bacterium]|jgi:dephospho-CoA kinase
MLRVGLTGGLGSGKSTVAGMFEQLGAAVISADQLGRQLMQPGEPVYAAIVQTFGPAVVRGDGSLDRKALAELAFQHNQADALNHIVHPAVVHAEEEWMRGVFATDPARVAIVESALIFEVEKWGTAPGWTQRFDKLILVTVPDEIKIRRFVARMEGSDGAEADARARIAAQIADEVKASRCNYVIDNTGPVEQTRKVVEEIYRELVEAAR